MRKGLIFFLLGIILLLSHISVGFSKTTLSLNEAILLAVRSNPNVQATQLNDVAQKFNLYIQQWEFYPHYSFQATAGFNRTGSAAQKFYGSHNYSVQPAVSLLTPVGTQVTLTGTNSDFRHYNPGLSLQIMQPLLRGFGMAVVEAALANAKDTVTISRLDMEGVLRATVSAVINAYLDVVYAERTLIIDQDAVQRAQKSVEQTKLYIKAGHKAGNELVTVEANVASAQTQLINDTNSLTQARYGLLTAIGVDPNSDIDFSSLSLSTLINKYHLLPLDITKQRVLETDIQYQVDQITLHGSTTRSLLTAEDNTRWQLNFTANALTGNGLVPTFNNDTNNLINAETQTETVGLTLQIPIDDQLAKQAVLNAKLAIKQAELALKQERWSKETDAINGWNLVASAEHALRFAEHAQQLQEKTYNISYQKYLHGLIDSLELQSAQLNLIQSQQTKLSAEINYIKALVNLDLLVGNTLSTWNISVRQ